MFDAVVGSRRRRVVVGKAWLKEEARAMQRHLERSLKVGRKPVSGLMCPHKQSEDVYQIILEYEKKEFVTKRSLNIQIFLLLCGF